MSSSYWFLLLLPLVFLYYNLFFAKKVALSRDLHRFSPGDNVVAECITSSGKIQMMPSVFVSARINKNFYEHKVEYLVLPEGYQAPVVVQCVFRDNYGLSV